MTTMNDLLYNYQDTNEFVCSDGRMSVNGICQVDQPAANVDTSITEEIIETFHDGDGNRQKIKDWEEKVKRDKVLKDLEGTSDYFPKLGKEKSGIFADLKSIFKRKEKEKINQGVISPEINQGVISPEINQKVISPSFVDQSIVPTSDIKHIPPESITHNKIPTIDKTLDKVESIIEKTAPKKEKEKNQLESIIEKTPPKKEKFEWEFDKDKKIDTYKNTVNNNINEYNNFIEQNLGIPTSVQNAARVGGSAVALAGGSGILTAVAPWAIPFIAGGAIRKAEKERIENITAQDKQGGNINTVDMMTYDIPQPGEDGFNPHQDKGDQPHGTDTSGNFAGKGSGNPFDY